MSSRSCVQHGAEEVDGIMDMSNAGGMASLDWIEVCGDHRAVRQRASADEFGRVMEHAESNGVWIKDDHRKKSGRKKINVTHSVWPCIGEQAGLILGLQGSKSVRKDGKTVHERRDGQSARGHGDRVSTGRRISHPLHPQHGQEAKSGGVLHLGTISGETGTRKGDKTKSGGISDNNDNATIFKL